MSSINIDSLVFFTEGPFFFQEGAPRIGRTEVEANTGSIYSYTRYSRDNFNIDFAALNETEATKLRNIIEATGTNAHHTLIYITPERTKTYDSATTNTDVNRIRKKVIIESDGLKHIDGYPNLYRCTIKCKET